MDALLAPFAHADELRLAMRVAAGSVSIVTTGRGSVRTDMTVTSVLSLSMAPLTMLVAMDGRASSWPVFQDAELRRQ